MIDQKGYDKAIELLHRASTPPGFVAAVQDQDNYKRVWTRDGTINSLAALVSGDEPLIQTALATIRTIFDHQHPSGFMPSNVSPADGKASYGGTVGRADNPSWAVIGVCQYVLTTGDHALAAQYKNRVERCFALMDAWEYNGKQLLYVPQSGDWADEYIQHGYILFNQLLRVWALQLAARVYGRDDWQQKREQVLAVIRANFWNNQPARQLYAPNLQHQLADAPTLYWFMGFNPARIYQQFDLQANSFALLLGVGNALQNKTLVAFLKELYAQQQGLLPSFSPVIQDGDRDMEELKNNYAYHFRNRPYEFHNGGLWSVWNGWLATALVKQGEHDVARQLTKDLHAANALNHYEFNECLQGQTRRPAGVPNCAWSAGGAVLAEKAESVAAFFTANTSI